MNNTYTLLIGFSGVLIGSITSILVVVIQAMLQARKDRLNTILSFATQMSRNAMERIDKMDSGGEDQLSVYYTQLASVIIDAVEKKLSYQEVNRKRAEILQLLIKPHAEQSVSVYGGEPGDLGDE